MVCSALTFPSYRSAIFGRWFGCRHASLVDLPNDVFLEEIFTRLDIQDIIAVRGVNRRLYVLTHEPVIWKRLLRRMNIALPPIPPTSRHAVAALNNLEAERLLVRAISLSTNLRMRNPEPFYDLSVEAFYHVQSMEILPGGKYLVASVRDKTRQCYAVMIYTLDYRLGGALALAKTPTPTKAYNLQAKYMTFQGLKGIMIAYILRDVKHRKHRNATGGIDLSEMSTETELDLSVPMKYTCTTLFVTLDNLDKLSDPVSLFPGSREYNMFALEQAPPFRLLAEVLSSSSLGHICLEEIFGVPYMAVVKGIDQILFKNLTLDGYSTLTCNAFDVAPPEDYSILKIRFLPPQSSIFVIRRIKTRCILFETYPIPFHNEHISNQDPDTFVTLDRDDFDQICITDNPPLASRYYNLDIDSPPDLTSQASRSISVFVAAGPDLATSMRTVYRLSLIAKPWHSGRPLPTVPFRLPDRIENDTIAKEAFICDFATHFYEINGEISIQPFGFSSAKGRIRILPGSNYSLLYWTVDTIKDCSTLNRLGVYFTPSPLINSQGDQSEQRDIERIWVDGRTMIRKQSRIKFLHIWKSLWDDLTSKPVRCMAWDESIGRLCLSHENDSRIHIVDFAQAPFEDAQGERLPVPVRLDENPTKSSFFTGKLFNPKL